MQTISNHAYFLKIYTNLTCFSPLFYNVKNIPKRVQLHVFQSFYTLTYLRNSTRTLVDIASILSKTLSTKKLQHVKDTCNVNNLIQYFDIIYINFSYLKHFLMAKLFNLF